MKLAELHTINEGKIKDFTKGALAGAAIGAGLIGSTMIPYNPKQGQTQTQTVQDQPKTNTDKRASHFPGEFDIIKKAADRNNCKGDLFTLLLAIRKAENGGRGKEFGVLNPKANDLDKQAGWAAATIVKNYNRWQQAGGDGNFIDYLSKVYCPIGAENDPTNLNVNWSKNVKSWYNQLR